MTLIPPGSTARSEAEAAIARLAELRHDDLAREEITAGALVLAMLAIEEQLGAITDTLRNIAYHAGEK